jgi:hypothetical protein
MAAFRRLIHHIRSIRSGRSKPNGGSSKPTTRMYAMLKATSKLAAVSSRGK